MTPFNVQSYIQDNDLPLSINNFPYLLKFCMLSTISYKFDNKPPKHYMKMLNLKIWLILSTLSLLSLNKTVLLQ